MQFGIDRLLRDARLRGDRQDNMIESPDFTDPIHGIPVFSLYGEVRRPTDAMLEHCDLLLIDLQDLGCRIYTFVTILCYVVEEAARLGRSVWVLDRPNPDGWPSISAACSSGRSRSRGSPLADALTGAEPLHVG